MAVGQLYLLKKMLDKQGQGYQPVWFVISLIIVFSMLKGINGNGVGEECTRIRENLCWEWSASKYKVLKGSWSKESFSSMPASLLLSCKVLLPFVQMKPQFLRIPSITISISLPSSHYSSFLHSAPFTSLIPISPGHYKHSSFNSHIIYTKFFHISPRWLS